MLVLRGDTTVRRWLARLIFVGSFLWVPLSALPGDLNFVEVPEFDTNPTRSLPAQPDDGGPHQLMRLGLERFMLKASVNSSGDHGDDDSFAPSISVDSRYVAFQSRAANLVPGITNEHHDIFVYDRVTGSTTRVSLDSSGGQTDDGSSWPSISGDGNFVAFESLATNLVPGDTNGEMDVFIHDRAHGTTSRVSVDSSGIQGYGQSYRPSISADGRYVAFESSVENLVPYDNNENWDVFVHDRITGATTRTSVESWGYEGDGRSGSPSISADGRYVAFQSYARNLVIDDTNWTWDIFVRDRSGASTTRVSVDSSGLQANFPSESPSISADGRYIAFQSFASNLVPGDTNEHWDVFVHDRITGATTRVSVDSFGTEGDDDSTDPSISGDGRYVAFKSWASNLVPGDSNRTSDIFVHDLVTGTTICASVGYNGTHAIHGASSPSISFHGHSVAFNSKGNNLVHDTYGFINDVYVFGFRNPFDAYSQ